MSYNDEALETEETEIEFNLHSEKDDEQFIVNNKPKVQKLSVKERMVIKAGLIIAAVEGMIDDYDKNSEELPDFYNFMRRNDIRGKVADIVRAPFLKTQQELQEVQTLRRNKKDAKTDLDEQLLEGYERVSNQDLNKMISLYDSIVVATSAIVDNSKRTRKSKKMVRKKKGKSPSKIVEKLKYCEEDADLMIHSENPEKIVGAKLLFVYNKGYNTINMIFANTNEGLSVKGTTIVEVSEQKSKAYKVGKKTDIINEVMNLQKFDKAAEWFREQKLKEAKVSTRINKHCLLLKTLY